MTAKIVELYRTKIVSTIRKILRYSALTTLSIIIFSNGCAPQAESYQELVADLVNSGKFNGSILVAKGGEIEFQEANGIRNLKGDSITLSSQFRLASVSKQFTAMAIMTLKEKGSLNFDDPISDHIEGWPYPGTIRNLLNHTSGSPDYVGLFWSKDESDLAADDPKREIGGNDEIIATLIERKPEARFEPGAKYEYSNTGYVLLATIVERVSQIPFHEYMQENVFKPAGMTDTFVFSPKREDPLIERVYGLRNNKKRLNDYNFLNPAAGDGGMYSTLSDLFTWNKALYTDQIVSQETLQEAYKPATLNDGTVSYYGFGWGLSEGSPVVAHSGAWVGFRTYISRNLETKDCWILLTNDSGSSYENSREDLEKFLW